MLLETVEADREGGMGQKKGEVVVKRGVFSFQKRNDVYDCEASGFA